uniref:Uncharacterized protein n=1 Tax=Romanomermis culicivorax TaxID=13658 RepID=A0A915I7A7_ROMCU
MRGSLGKLDALCNYLFSKTDQHISTIYKHLDVQTRKAYINKRPGFDESELINIFIKAFTDENLRLELLKQKCFPLDEAIKYAENEMSYAENEMSLRQLVKPQQNVDQTMEGNQQISSPHIDQSFKVESEQTIHSNIDKDMLLDDMDIIDNGVAEKLETEMSELFDNIQVIDDQTPGEEQFDLHQLD